MKTLDIHEAVALLKGKLQDVPGLHASTAVVMWKALLWGIGVLYPRYKLVDTQPGEEKP